MTSIEFFLLRMISRTFNEPIVIMRHLLDSGIKGHIVKISLISHLVKNNKFNEAYLVANEIASQING